MFDIISYTKAKKALDAVNQSDYGSSTIASGATSVVVSHTLGVAPSFVNATSQGNVGSVWVTTITSTQFTINCSTAPSANTLVSWHARV